MIIANVYRDQVAGCNTAIGRLKYKLNGLSILRVLLFAALCYTVYALIQAYSATLLVLTFIFAAGFIGCISVYYTYKQRRRLLETLRFVGTNELLVLGGKANGFPDGASWLDDDNYLDDLDIFGQRSVFHTINRTTTVRGAAALAGRLRQPLLQPGAISAQQDAVRVLAGQPELRRLLTATGLLLQQHGTGGFIANASNSTAKADNSTTNADNSAAHANSGADLDMRKLREWLDTPSRIANRLLLRIAVAVAELFSFCAIYLFLASNVYTPLLLAFLVCRLVQLGFVKYIGHQHQLIGHNHEILDQFGGILAVFNKVDTTGSAVLQELRTHTGHAHTAIRRLSRLTNAFDQRMNLLVNLVLSNFFFYDLHCMIGLEKWKAANRAAFLSWLDAVATVESLNSLATYAFNHPENVYPIPLVAVALDGASTPGAESCKAVSEGSTHASEGSTFASEGSTFGSEACTFASEASTFASKASTPASEASTPASEASTPAAEAPALFIETTGLGHPLIPANRRIANDLTIGREERLILVTGSNMSGKTTFLRTLGVNLLLAQCGLPVCAVSFAFTPMQLLTSLRISDSLQDQTSYFMAELKKLQKIIGRLDTGAPALVLIDEILRGTNSEDKTYGSEQFIYKLLAYPCLSLFATHDLSLGQLEQTQPGAVRNYCFESIIESGELHFDYRLQPGIARNRNASFLMKKMNII